MKRQEFILGLCHTLILFSGCFDLTDNDPHRAEEGDQIGGRIYNYWDTSLEFEIIISTLDGDETFADTVVVDSNSAHGLGNIGEVFFEYVADIKVSELDISATEPFEAIGIGTLEIRLLANGELETVFLPID